MAARKFLDDQALRALYKAGLTSTDLAGYFDCSRVAVCAALHRTGVICRRQGRFVPGPLTAGQWRAVPPHLRWMVLAARRQRGASITVQRPGPRYAEGLAA